MSGTGGAQPVYWYIRYLVPDFSRARGSGHEAIASMWDSFLRAGCDGCDVPRQHVMGRFPVCSSAAIYDGRQDIMRPAQSTAPRNVESRVDSEKGFPQCGRVGGIVFVALDDVPQGWIDVPTAGGRLHLEHININGEYKVVVGTFSLLGLAFFAHICVSKALHERRKSGVLCEAVHARSLPLLSCHRMSVASLISVCRGRQCGLENKAPSCSCVPVEALGNALVAATLLM